MKFLLKTSISFSGLLCFPLALSVLGLFGCGSAGSQQAPARINNAIVTENEIRIEAAAELESIELRKLRDAASHARAEREVMMEALERVLAEKLLTLEAAERNISKEQLVESEIYRKVTEPAEEDIDLFYELNRTRINRPKTEVAEQIKRLLRERDEQEIRNAFLRQLEEKHTVVRNLEPFRFDVKTDGHPAIGPKNAPVKLVLFSDFQCPYCLDFGVTLMEIVKAYEDRVQLVFRQFPLTSIHPDAQRAAEASLCARDQGLFWEMHDILFENQRSLTEENILAQIQSLKIDAEKFRECLVSGRHKSEVLQDIRAGSAAGTDSTPTLFVNGIHLSGGQSYEFVSAIINKELENSVSLKK